MSFIKKIWATLAGSNSQQRPDPNAANSDLREETIKNMNEQKQEEAEERQEMQEEGEKAQEDTTSA